MRPGTVPSRWTGGTASTLFDASKSFVDAEVTGRQQGMALVAVPRPLCSPTH